MLKKFLVGIILSAIIFVGCSNEEKTFERTENFMHTAITLKATGKNSKAAVDESFLKIAELEKNILLDTEKINVAAGNGEFISVTPEVYEMLQTSQKYSELTDGAFDVTIGAAVDLWKICRKENRLPTDAEISSVKNLVGYKNLQLNDGKAKLSKAGMKINLGGVAKGFGVDEVRKIFSAKKIDDGLIDFGTSTIYVLGTKKIGLRSPHEENKLSKVLELKDCAISTSGSYENFFVVDGKTFHHILNPKTCLPVETEIASASVIIYGGEKNSATAADILSTTAFILGEENLQSILKKTSLHFSILTE